MRLTGDESNRLAKLEQIVLDQGKKQDETNEFIRIELRPALNEIIEHRERISTIQAKCEEVLCVNPMRTFWVDILKSIIAITVSATLIGFGAWQFGLFAMHNH